MIASRRAYGLGNGSLIGRTIASFAFRSESEGD